MERLNSQNYQKRGDTTIDKYIDRALDIENRVKICRFW